MTPSDELADRIAALLTAQGVRFESKRMMGGLCFKVADKMLVGTAKNRLMVRFDPARHDDVLARPGAGPMDFTGKPMRGYVFVKPVALKNDAVLAAWLDLALDFNPRANRSKKKAAKSSRPRKSSP
ncbi:MAG: TfoX/Sxy family protein [Opitutus sp.]